MKTIGIRNVSDSCSVEILDSRGWYRYRGVKFRKNELYEYLQGKLSEDRLMKLRILLR